MSSALGVTAFVVVVLELVALVAVGFLVRRYWRLLEPQVRPLLAMFAPAPPAAKPGATLDGPGVPSDPPTPGPPASLP